MDISPELLRSLIDPILVILESAAKLTKTPFDDMAVSLLRRLVSNDAMLDALAKVLSNLLTSKGVIPKEATLADIAEALNHSDLESHVSAVLEKK